MNHRTIDSRSTRRATALWLALGATLVGCSAEPTPVHGRSELATSGPAWAAPGDDVTTAGILVWDQGSWASDTPTLADGGIVATDAGFADAADGGVDAADAGADAADAGVDAGPGARLWAAPGDDTTTAGVLVWDVGTW